LFYPARHLVFKSLFLLSILLFSCVNQTAKKNEKLGLKEDGFYNTERGYKNFSSHFIDSLHDFFPNDFNGTVLVYKQGKLFKKAFGKIGLAQSPEMLVDDIFQLASVSKTVTAVATMLLIQEGKLALDSLALKYLPDFPYPNVSIRQLLTHRSGLANYMYFTDSFWHDTAKYMDQEDFYQFMKRSKPTPYLNPGVSFSYCNTNYAFLAYMISKISGMPFHQFVEERIFKPAGMRNSFYLGHKPERIKARVLTGRFDHYEYNETYYMDGVLGDKSLFSNVEDMFYFHLALSEGRLINKTLLNLMQEPSFRHTVFGGSYGLGFRLMKNHTGQWTYHNGWWRGFWTSFWNRFDKQVCVVVLTNNKNSSHVDKQGLANFVLTGR
jgi:CubicO group peptidase (beta-lactamase class C family)